MTITGIDVEQARALTPGCTRVIHFNHAGSGLIPQPVRDIVTAPR